ncbi:MAG: hypothetical protein ABSA96_18035, partial [Candidatus Acidiferrales bacterium]
QPNLQKKQNQENSRSSFPFSFSPCSLIKSTKTVSEMLARRAVAHPSFCTDGLPERYFSARFSVTAIQI